MLNELVRRILYLIPALPKTAQIGITNRCNFNCQMCQRNDLEVQFVDMDFDSFKFIIDHLTGVTDIILTGWGEPLLHPRLFDMIAYCRQKRIKVRFTTNGALLNKGLAVRLADSGVDAVTFSLDQIKSGDTNLGHIITYQLNNIIEFKKIIDEQKRPIKIYLQATYHKNHEQDIFDVADFAIKHGLSRLRVSRLDVRFRPLSRPTLAEEKQVVNLLDKHLSGAGVGLDFLPHTAFDGWAKRIYRIIYPFLHRNGRYCLRTYNDIYIDVDGLVTPCCALPRLGMGNLKENTLEEIWQGGAFKNFRRNQKIICGKCDILKVKPFV